MIISKERIELSDIQNKMLKSGWGTDTAENTITEKITYLSDGLKVKGYISTPKDTSKKYPSIIWCRGGFGNAGAIDSFNAAGIFGQIASWGYTVFATQYRGNDGSEGNDEFGGADLNDILNLIPLADEVSCADSSNWGIEGWSRGGMMTYLALTKTDIFKAAVITGGIANLRCNAEESPFMKKLYEMTMGTYGTKPFSEVCRSRSIINMADELSPETAMLILHGTADNRVLPHDSVDLAAKLLGLKRHFRLVMLENGDHFLKSHRVETSAMRKHWFDKYLKNQDK